MIERFRFRAGLIGGGVQECMVNQRTATICAVFRRSFYLETADGGLACIGPAEIGAGPINMICDLPGGIDWDVSGLGLGDRATISDHRIVVNGRYEFDFGDAKIWRPTTLPEHWTVVALIRGLDVLEDAASTYDLSDGLSAKVRRDGATIAAADKAYDALCVWLMDALDNSIVEKSNPPHEIALLIGLGPGLTPSGDDLIGGALVALNMFGRQDAADCLARWSLPIARRNTGKISNAHLARATKGEGADALHRTIATIAGGNTAALETCLQDIDAIGHSSGWDALAGAVAVMRWISQQ